MAASSSCSSPRPLLPGPASLLRLADMAATFYFLCSSGSKAEHISQRHRRRQDTDMTGHTGCPSQGLPSTAPTQRTHVTHRHRQLFFSWQRCKFTSEGTHRGLYRFTSTHKFRDPLSTGTVLLYIQHLFLYPRPNLQYMHTQESANTRKLRKK